MRKLFMLLTFVAFCSPLLASAAGDFSPEEIEAARKDPQAFTVDPSSVRIVRLETRPLPLPPAPLPPEFPPVPSPPGGINPDIIVNIGKLIWGIIDANRPVVDVKQSYAAAVPDGITHWTQLAGWNPPELTEYEFSANNLKGSRAIQVRFQVMRTTGGNFQGKGKYLTGVTVEPTMISVPSGYKFYLEAAVPKESVANVGKEEPIAGMIATLKWKIKTVSKETQGSRIFYVQGDGLFREITGLSESFMPAARKALRGLETSSIGW